MTLPDYTILTAYQKCAETLALLHLVYKTQRMFSYVKLNVYEPSNITLPVGA